MNKKITLACALVFSTTITSANAQQNQVPNIFSPNTPAVAAEVNENFAFITDRLAEIEAASYGYNLRDGELEIDVDCTNDAAALNQAYNEYWQYREVNFVITGDCYGDITVNRSGVDGEGNWDGSRFQPTGQTLNISAQDGEDAGLIPNDLSGSVTIWASFTGGLYIYNMSITLSDQFSDIGAGFSRNAHGELNGVTVIGPEAVTGIGAYIQEGAQMYLNDSTVSNTNHGLLMISDGLARLGGTIELDNVNTGLNVIASSIRSRAAITINANNTAIGLFAASTFNGFRRDVTVTSGEITIINGSMFETENFYAENSSMWLDASVFAASGSATLASMNTSMSRFSANGGEITGQINHWENSSVLYSGVTLSEVTSDTGSIVNMNGGTAARVFVRGNSTLNINDASISEFVEATDSAFASLFNITSASVKAYSFAQVNISGENKPEFSALECDASYINYENASMLDDAPDSGCLDAGAVNELRQMLLDARASN